ncbi:hypothetical protein CRUP_013441 [Coryphaenoides rupestris]|nr:hypothetical protein CRUP_013441 [Coryphaenoides rupestris]
MSPDTVWVVLRRGVQVDLLVSPPPPDHFSRRPSGDEASCTGPASRLHSCTQGTDTPGRGLASPQEYSQWLPCRHDASLLPMKEDLGAVGSKPSWMSVLHKQPREVCLCLMELGRIASRYGIEPPGLGTLSPSLSPSPSPTPATEPPPEPQIPETPDVSGSTQATATCSACSQALRPPFVSTNTVATQTQAFFFPTTPANTTPLAPTPAPMATPTPTPPPSAPSLPDPPHPPSRSAGRRSAGPAANLLDDIVRNLVENPACRCPVTFLVEKQPKGRYRVGEKVLYVRTFMGYLSKHDPCRGGPACRGAEVRVIRAPKSPQVKDLSPDSYMVVGVHSRGKK